MLEALLVVAVLAAALACPAMMWYANRRGRPLACPPRRAAEPDLAQLRAERAKLDDRIAAAREDAAAGRP